MRYDSRFTTARTGKNHQRAIDMTGRDFLIFVKRFEDGRRRRIQGVSLPPMLANEKFLTNIVQAFRFKCTGIVIVMGIKDKDVVNCSWQFWIWSGARLLIINLAECHFRASSDSLENIQNERPICHYCRWKGRVPCLKHAFEYVNRKNKLA